MIQNHTLETSTLRTITEDLLSSNLTNSQRLEQICTRVTQENPQIAACDYPYQVFLKLKEAAKQPFLDLSQYQPAKTGYNKFVLYTHKDSEVPFCLTLIVLAPGQSTPRHSHRVDCGPVCVLGTITEVHYESTEQEEEKALHVTKRLAHHPGDGGYLHKEGPNIHHIENTTTEIAMSLHLYLFDPEKCCPSLNTSVAQIFP